MPDQDLNDAINNAVERVVSQLNSSNLDYQALEIEKRELEAALRGTHTADSAELRRLWLLVEALEVNLRQTQEALHREVNASKSNVLELQAQLKRSNQARDTLQMGLHGALPAPQADVAILTAQLEEARSQLKESRLHVEELEADLGQLQKPLRTEGSTAPAGSIAALQKQVAEARAGQERLQKKVEEVRNVEKKARNELEKELKKARTNENEANRLRNELKKKLKEAEDALAKGLPNEQGKKQAPAAASQKGQSDDALAKKYEQENKDLRQEVAQKKKEIEDLQLEVATLRARSAASQLSAKKLQEEVNTLRASQQQPGLESMLDNMRQQLESSLKKELRKSVMEQMKAEGQGGASGRGTINPTAAGSTEHATGANSLPPLPQLPAGRVERRPDGVPHQGNGKRSRR